MRNYKKTTDILECLKSKNVCYQKIASRKLGKSKQQNKDATYLGKKAHN